MINTPVFSSFYDVNQVSGSPAISPLYLRDIEYLNTHGDFAGIDEAGRGTLAGPVVVAAVCLDYSTIIPGLNDSKLLSPKKRAELYDAIILHAKAYAIVEIDNHIVDEKNILQATYLGFEAAYSALDPQPALCLIDGNRIPASMLSFASSVVKGDRLHASIAAASILAKVHRDRLMDVFDTQYPQYGFAKHKGYATQEHCRAIHSLGFCEIHRTSFRVPIR